MITARWAGHYVVICQRLCYTRCCSPVDSPVGTERFVSPLSHPSDAPTPPPVPAAFTSLTRSYATYPSEMKSLQSDARPAPSLAAFTSLTRSYATYPSEMKAMLSVRTLHLGHYAKSLCLRETPTALGRYRGEGAGGDGGRFKR